jgi:hypothetical protein
MSTVTIDDLLNPRPRTCQVSMGHGRVCGEPVPEGQQACVLHEESAEGVFSALDRLFGDWS